VLHGEEGHAEPFGLSSNQPRAGSGTAEPASARHFITLYWTSKSASRNKRCFVGWTRKTRRCSSLPEPSSHFARHSTVSLEKPFEAGASTSVTSGAAPGPSLVASHSASVRCSSMGSRSFRSGIGRAYVATNVTARGAPRRSGGADGAPERARRHDALRRGGHRPGGATAQSHGHRLGHLLVTAGVGTSEDGTSAQLSGDALAFRAAGEVDDDWIERFTLLAGAAPGSAPLGGKGALRCAVLWPGSGAAARTARG